MKLEDMLDLQFISELAQIRTRLISEHHANVDAATLAHEAGYKTAFPVLIVVRRQEAWEKLGLDHEKECAGPQYTYH